MCSAQDKMIMIQKYFLILTNATINLFEDISKCSSLQFLIDAHHLIENLENAVGTFNVAFGRDK